MEILGESLGQSDSEHMNTDQFGNSADAEGERFVADCMRQVPTPQIQCLSVLLSSFVPLKKLFICFSRP